MRGVGSWRDGLKYLPDILRNVRNIGKIDHRVLYDEAEANERLYPMSGLCEIKGSSIADGGSL